MAPIQKEKTAQGQTAQKDSLTVSIRPIAPARQEGERADMENVYSKADSNQQKMALSPKARELAQKRLEEIEKENADWIGKIDPAPYHIRTNEEVQATLGTREHAKKMLDFGMTEDFLYRAALDGKADEVANYKNRLIGFGKEGEYGEYAKKIIDRFEEIVREQ